MTKNLKTLFFFYLLPSVPEAAFGKSPELRARGLGHEGGQIKTNFSLFSFVCVCHCVRSISVRVKQYGRLFVCLFFFKVWVSRFLCWCNVSQVLHIFYINSWTKYGAALREMRLAIQTWIAPSYPYITYLLHSVVFQLYLGTCARTILFWARALFIYLIDVYI